MRATWLRNNKEPSPVLARLCLRRKVKPILQTLPRACKSQFNAVKISKNYQSHKAARMKQGTPLSTSTPCSLQTFEGNWPASTTQKGHAAHVPSPSSLSPKSFSCCRSRSTVRKRLCCCDNSTREHLWHSEHKERGESSDSEVPLHTSLVSWHKRSIDKRQLNATRRNSQSSRKREITALVQCCPTTSMARLSTLWHFAQPSCANRSMHVLSLFRLRHKARIRPTH